MYPLKIAYFLGVGSLMFGGVKCTIERWLTGASVEYCKESLICKYSVRCTALAG